MNAWCKNYQDFGGNIFLLSISWVYTLFRQTFGLTNGFEGYGGPNLGEKWFQLFHILQYRQICNKMATKVNYTLDQHEFVCQKIN